MEAAPQVPVSPGDVLLGKYVVERVIGAGGMGVVVAVKHRDLQELYAMKFMLPAALANDQAVDRFVREARAAAKLKSEHVAKVHDVGRLENGSPYMVMEYLTGRDLEATLQVQGPLVPDVAATYVMQACDAIAEAHEAGVVHRDLKPANLFLTKRANGSPCIKVLDFGISKSLSDEQLNSMTKTSAIMGSPYYMSPEQMRSSKNVDGRTDIWALGVILYQLSTGRVPFPGETITEVCSGVLADEPASLTSFPGIPEAFDGIVRRCLQKNPATRFANARELANALAVVAGASPGTSGLNLQLAGALPGARPGTMAMQGPPPGLTAQLAKSSPGQPGQTQTEFSQGAAPSPPKRSSTPLVLALVGLAVVGGGIGAFMFSRQPADGATATATNSPAADAPKDKPGDTTANAPTPTPPSAAPVESAIGATTGAPVDSASPSASAAPATSTEPVAEKTAKPSSSSSKTPTASKTASAATTATSKPPTPPPTATTKPTVGGGMF
jgi:serine/threonine protein kinase